MPEDSKYNRQPPKKYREKTPGDLKRVKATRSKKPGYIRGTVTAQTAMLKKLRELHRQGMQIIANALRRPGRKTETVLLREIDMAIAEWTPQVLRDAMPIIFQLYGVGLKAGIGEVGVVMASDLPDPAAIEAIARSPHGFVPALENFIEEERKFAERVITQSFTGEQAFDLDEVVKTIESRVPKEKWRLERLVRTETSKIAGFGRLTAWEADPKRDWYLYHWIATIDGRQKKVSEKFMREGPYSFEKIKALWENPVARVYVDGKWIDQNDAFNQRCTIARTLKPKEQLIREGHVTAEEAEKLF